jgi:hypothetical protein
MEAETDEALVKIVDAERRDADATDLLTEKAETE